MNFDLSEDQAAIKGTAREFLAARYPPDEVRRLALEDERGWTDAQWEEIVGLGWPGLFVSEENGGMGLTPIELAVVSEELGYALAPTPLVPSWMAALLVDDPEVQAGIASGELRGAVAERGLAYAAEGADLLVTEEGWTREFDASPVDSLDLTQRLFSVRPQGPLAPLRADAARALLAIRLMLASESVGVAQRCLELSVAYAKERKQFGRPIGSFQGVSHTCAQMLLETEGARALVLNAAWTFDNEPDQAALAVAMAKAFASDAGVRVAGMAIQVHGGIGMTWEADLHLFLRRAQANAHSFGGSGEQRAAVAELLSL